MTGFPHPPPSVDFWAVTEWTSRDCAKKDPKRYTIDETSDSGEENEGQQKEAEYCMEEDNFTSAPIYQIHPGSMESTNNHICRQSIVDYFIF